MVGRINLESMMIRTSLRLVLVFTNTNNQTRLLSGILFPSIVS